MKFTRNLPFHTRRDAWVEVDLGAIECNAVRIREFVPEPIHLMAVVKADAYGHGAVMAIPTLEASGVSMVGVAAMDEALQIREAGLTIPILVLGPTPDWAMHYATENDVEITIFTPAHLKSIERLYQSTGEPMKVQIKVDTGMHRIGMPWEEAASFIRHCQSLPYVQVTGVFSHLANTQDAVFSQTQLDRWEQILESLPEMPPLRHIANSSGLMHYHSRHSNMVRSGIAFFGYPGDELPLPFQLRPAMGLKARIVHLHELPVGEGVSYNHSFVNRTVGVRKIATLPLGYADGVPRTLSNRIEGFYRGVRVPQVGNITMDQLMVDVTDVSDARVGDVISLIGTTRSDDEPHAETLTDWAHKAGTIEYELMCGLRVRLPKTYVR